VNVRILGCDDAAEWSAWLARMPASDVYFLSEYHRAHELNGDGRATAWAAEEGSHAFFYPFFIRPIETVAGEPPEERWFDIETVYGYSGPLCTTDDPSLLEAFWNAFGAWCRANRVVAEFLRFNPILGNSRLAGPECRVSLDRETVVIDLTGTEEDLLARYPSGQRTKLRRAQAAGLVSAQSPAAEMLETFRAIYRHTMTHLEARSYYFFNDAYFEHLAGSLGERARIFTVTDASGPIAAALFFVHGETMHYHLGGSDEARRESRPNNLLFHEAAHWGRAHGCRRLHLGGGRTSDPHDALLAFKRTLSRTRLRFELGRRVHDAAGYESLCAQWMQRMGRAERPNYFLLYRLEA
jgi:hypothetical protein